MKSSMLSKCLAPFGLLGALLTSADPVQAETSAAQHFVCGHGNEVREVAVKFGPDNQLPCEVTYTKQGQEETLWQALYEENYCGVRAQELIAKLEGFGWRCSLTDQAEATDELAAEQGAAGHAAVNALQPDSIHSDNSEMEAADSGSDEIVTLPPTAKANN